MIAARFALFIFLLAPTICFAPKKTEWWEFLPIEKQESAREKAAWWKRDFEQRRKEREALAFYCSDCEKQFPESFLRIHMKYFHTNQPKSKEISKEHVKYVGNWDSHLRDEEQMRNQAKARLPKQQRVKRKKSRTPFKKRKKMKVIKKRQDSDEQLAELLLREQFKKERPQRSCTQKASYADVEGVVEFEYLR